MLEDKCYGKKKKIGEGNRYWVVFFLDGLGKIQVSLIGIRT